jgi:hypothetical protein
MNDQINEQTRLLREILKWIKFVGMKEVKDILNNVLIEDTKKIVYHYSDGSRGTQDFKTIANVKSTATISRYWKEWYKLGIVEMINVKGGERAKKLFELEDFGIEIPILPTSSTQESSSLQPVINEGDKNVGQE